jgi:hypothetical protein
MATENANWIQWKAADGGNGHWYTVVHDPVSWTQARDAAASLGPATYLATITSAAENAFIQDQLLGGDAAPAIAWLGGFQAHGFYGTYELEDWSKSDIMGGTTSIGPASGASDAAEFSYKVEIGPSDIGVPYRTAEFSTIAEKSGTVSFDYEYDILHSWYDVNADFVLFSGTGAQEKLCSSLIIITWSIQDHKASAEPRPSMCKRGSHSVSGLAVITTTSRAFLMERCTYRTFQLR